MTNGINTARNDIELKSAESSCCRDLYYSFQFGLMDAIQ